MNKIGDILDHTTSDMLSMGQYSLKFKVDCSIHGKDSESFLSGKCIKCAKIAEDEGKLHMLNACINIMKIECNIPKLYLDSTFKNYIPNNPKAKEIFDFCKGFDFKSNLIFVGTPGTGKTHLSCALIDKAIRLNMKCKYTKFYNLPHIKIKDDELFKSILECDLLVIDEYGHNNSAFNQELLFSIIDQRTDNGVKTILLSNLTGEKFASKESISDSLYSRLKQNSIDCNFDWEDYRLKGSK